jgi:TonB family protein
MGPKLLMCLALTSSTLAHAQGASTGYVFCAKGEVDHSIPVFAGACTDRVAENLACGKQVLVTGRWGNRLNVYLRPGASRSINDDSVSQKPDQFLPLEMATNNILDCKAIQRDPANNHAPHPISSSEPSYPTGKRPVRDGTVVLGLQVGVDGRPRDVAVIVSLDPDFDKNAMNAVQKWRFEPARAEGHPFEMSIVVEVGFHISN